MLEQKSLFEERDPAPLNELLSVIGSGAENNTWILISGGAGDGEAPYRPGDEFENSSNAIEDLIHSGWFSNRSLFIAFRRELARRGDEGSRFAFYSVFRTVMRNVSAADLLNSVDAETLTRIAGMLRKRYERRGRLKSPEGARG